MFQRAVARISQAPLHVLRTGSLQIARPNHSTRLFTQQRAHISIVCLYRPSGSHSKEQTFPTVKLSISKDPTRRTFSTSSTLMGPRNTYAKITHRVRKRRYGFMARVRDRNGRKILQRRRAKGRKNLSH